MSIYSESLEHRLASRLAIPPIDWSNIPRNVRDNYTAPNGQPKVSAVCRSRKECMDLVKWFGHPDFAPYDPVILYIPGVQTAFVIQGMGFATAAELQDVAITVWEEKTERQGKGQNPILDIDEAREKAGMPRRENVDALVREAMWDRIKRHKAAPRTDPSRQPVYPNPTGKVQFPQHPGVPYEVKA